MVLILLKISPFYFLLFYLTQLFLFLFNIFPHQNQKYIIQIILFFFYILMLKYIQLRRLKDLFYKLRHPLLPHCILDLQ